MFNFQQAMNLLQQMRNPQQMLQKMGIPQEHLNTPQDALQYLLNSGKINQGQIDQLNSLMSQFKR